MNHLKKKNFHVRVYVKMFYDSDYEIIIRWVITLF
jgi:hypothetical protein